MNDLDFLKSFGGLDPELLERSEDAVLVKGRDRSKTRGRAFAAAAAVLIALGAAFGASLIVKGAPPAGAADCSVSAAQLEIVSEMSCEKSSDLTVNAAVTLFYGGSYQPDVYMTKTEQDANSLNFSFTYSDFLAVHPTSPMGGTFYECDYCDSVNDTVVMKGVTKCENKEAEE